MRAPSSSPRVRLLNQADNASASAPASLDPDARVAALSQALGPRADRFALRWVETCESTNSELTGNPPRDDDRIHVLVAEHQHGGRGRRGRSWQSWPGASLTFSALWRFPAGAPVPAGLSLVAGVALAEALERLGVEGIQLKWPNDVLVHGRKLAGILVELVPGRGRTPAAVLGIGINLRLPPGVAIPDQPAVTDLHEALDGEVPACEAVLAAVLEALCRILDTYALAGFSALRDAWQQRNAFAALPVRISGEDSAVTGTCLGVDEDGALLLRTEAGVERILSGDVSLRGLS
ncbi:MAG: biotin--[acetyl-CoA-carboxylase] ligase [Thauera phenolivorans]|uniref:biotin--[biotin carboxyl-carrier protein] ligase n=1 Tax=Thauera phenolivorans TaxID=1792543 RepID=A0A7X7LVQ3_9RHOO|nr:biotin--[acetyl-CoA-carboxylase] ligase [Thauera phenolivorans]